MHVRGEIREDVLGENAPRRGIEKAPALRIEPFTSLFEPIDSGEDARQMPDIDRDDEARTSEAAAELRAEAIDAVSAGSDRSQAVVPERGGGAQLPEGRRRRVALGAEHPVDHLLLQVRDRLALEAGRLLALEIGLCCCDAGMVQDRLSDENVSARRAVVLSRHASTK